MSSRIEEILEVLKEVISLWKRGAPHDTVAELRRCAVSRVAGRRNIADSTISDKFRRQLKPDANCTSDFDRLLTLCLQGNPLELENILCSHAVTRDDETRIRGVLREMLIPGMSNPGVLANTQIRPRGNI